MSYFVVSGIELYCATSDTLPAIQKEHPPPSHPAHQKGSRSKLILRAPASEREEAYFLLPMGVVVALVV